MPDMNSNSWIGDPPWPNQPYGPYVYPNTGYTTGTFILSKTKEERMEEALDKIAELVAGLEPGDEIFIRRPDDEASEDALFEVTVERKFK